MSSNTPATNNILSFIKTKEELNAFREGITALINSNFNLDKNKFTEALKLNFDSNQAQILQEYIKVHEAEQDLDKTLRDLIKATESLEEVKILLAFSPKLAFIERLSFWFKSYLGENLVLDISVDPAIMGGIVIVHKGKYLDLSLNLALNDYFIKNHDKIKSYI